ILYAINHYVHLGFNIVQELDIELAIEEICNSNWFSWEWPWDNNCTEYVQVCAISNIGKWNKFTPEKLEKLQKKDIQKPNPQVSNYSVIQFAILEIHPDHLTVDQLKKQLTNQRVSYNCESMKQDLISLLNHILSQEPELQKTELSVELLNSNEEK
ncbi:24670_t:CDS:2, partial [Dentiscutata erythropus]